MKILYITDTHFKQENLLVVDKFMEKILEKAREIKPDLVIHGGDLLHYKQMIHTLPMNKYIDMFDKLRKICPVHILVGNHDFVNEREFCTENHWMMALKQWDNVFVYNEPNLITVNKFNLTFCPYVQPGRFIESMMDIPWMSSNVIFAHQEFRGVKMGAYPSENGDEWAGENPIVISGHIHQIQTLHNNEILNENPEFLHRGDVFYPGSTIHHEFADNVEHRAVLIDLSKDELTNTVCRIELIDLGLPVKKTIIIDHLNTGEKIVGPKPNEEIKLHIKCDTYKEGKEFEKSDEYRRLKDLGYSIKVSIVPSSQCETKQYNGSLSFSQRLQLKVEERKDNYLKQIYDKIKPNLDT